MKTLIFVCTMNPEISVVIPTYNEEGNIRPLYDGLHRAFKELNISSFEIWFINDGSSDESLENIKVLSKEDDRVKFISFSRNFGHQNALKAGLEHAQGRAVISMDADLQHPPSVLSKLIQEWKEGFQVVYTIRKDEKGQSWLKKGTSKGFYWIVNKMAENTIIPGAADFRLLDRKVVEAIKQFPEKELFFRGLISGLGFKQKGIEFNPGKRHSGKTKYSFKRMAKFAIAGITSSSAKPLYFSIYMGALMAFVAFAYGTYAIWLALYTDKTVAGWSSIVTSIVFIGGIQLMMMGIIGIYLGKIFKESKNRPLYIIDEIKK